MKAKLSLKRDVGLESDGAKESEGRASSENNCEWVGWRVGLAVRDLTLVPDGLALTLDWVYSMFEELKLLIGWVSKLVDGGMSARSSNDFDGRESSREKLRGRLEKDDDAWYSCPLGRSDGRRVRVYEDCTGDC